MSRFDDCYWFVATVRRSDIAKFTQKILERGSDYKPFSSSQTLSDDDWIKLWEDYDPPKEGESFYRVYDSHMPYDDLVLKEAAEDGCMFLAEHGPTHEVCCERIAGIGGKLFECFIDNCGRPVAIMDWDGNIEEAPIRNFHKYRRAADAVKTELGIPLRSRTKSKSATKDVDAWIEAVTNVIDAETMFGDLNLKKDYPSIFQALQTICQQLIINSEVDDQPEAIHPDELEGKDALLRDGLPSEYKAAHWSADERLWIRIQTVDVGILHNKDGLSIDVWPSDECGQEPISSMWLAWGDVVAKG